MSTPLAYRLRIRDEADSADALVLSSLRSDTNPYLAEFPTGDGSTLDPIAGKVTVGAYTVRVIDADNAILVTSREVALETFEGYANTAALLAAWPETDPDSLGTFTLDTTNPFAGTQAVKFTKPALVGSYTQDAYLRRTFTGLTSSTLHRVSVRCWLDKDTSASTNDVGIRVGSTIAKMPTQNPINAYLLLTVEGSSDGSGNLTVDLGMFTVGDQTEPRTAYFDALSITELGATGGRIVTGSLADETGQQHLLSRKAFVESTEDGVIWDNLVAAYVNSLRLIDAITFEFTIGESKRIEQASRVFDRISDPVESPDFIGILDRASCIVGGPIVGDFGPTADRGRPIFRVTDSATTTEGDTYVFLQWESGFLYHGAFHEGQPPVSDDDKDFFDSCAKDYLDEAAAQHFAPVVLIAPLANVVVRVYDPASGAWLADQQAAMTHVNVAPFKGDPWSFITSDGTIQARWIGTAPSVGTRYQVAVFPREMSTRNPLHLSDHPVGIYLNLAALKGIAVNFDSAVTVIAALGPMVVDLQVTAGDTFENWVTENLFGPFGFTVRTNSAGERELITTRIRPAATPSTVVTNADLVTDQGDVFSLDESSAAIKVTLETRSFRTTRERTDSTPIDSIKATKVTLEIDPTDPVTIFGDREIRYTIPGSIRGLLTGTTENPGTLDLWAANQYGVLFDWVGRGQITSEIQVRRGVVTELVGDEIVLDLAHLPTASSAQSPTSQRGTIARRCQILRRTEQPEGPSLLLLDRGPAAPDAPAEVIELPTCDTVTPPTDLAVSMAGTTASLTWTVGDTSLAVEVSIRLATDDVPVVIQVLPAGSNAFTFTLPAETTEYTFAVRHVDAPPLHCASAYDEVNATTEAFPTLSPPINPAAYADGAGTFGCAVTAVELAASVEFWFAAETAVGSGVAGAYTLYATVPSVANGRTQADTGIAANDGTLRYLIARHVQTGMTPSAYTDPVSINPWLLVPPINPEPPVVPPLGLTILPAYITLVTGTVPLGIREFPEAATRLAEWRGTEKLIEAAGATAAHIIADILYSNAPVGGAVAIQYQHPCSCTWDYLDGVSGPLIPVDTASLDALDTCAADVDDPWVIKGEPVTLVDDAKTAVRFRAVGLGGTGTEDLILPELTIVLTTQAVDIPDPEFPDPPPEVPTSTSEYVEQTGGAGVTVPVGFFQAFACDGIPSAAGEVTIRAGFFHSRTPGSYTRIAYFDHLRITDADGTVLWSDGMEYADITALLAAGWSVVDTMGSVSTTSMSTTQKTEGAKALKIAVTGAPSGNSDCYFTRTVTGLPAGEVVTFEADVYENEEAEGSTGIACGIEMDSAGATGIGTGTDPVPPPPTGGYPPPPTGGARPFGISGIPVGGLGYWDSTIQALRVSNAAELLALSTAGGSKNIFKFGSDASWLDAAGRFSYDLWAAQFFAVYNSNARGSVEAGIADETFWADWLIDEPFHPRWGGISLQTLDRMATYSKSLYPTLRTLIRIAPNDARLTRPIANCDTYFADYKLSNGDCATYRDAAVAAAEAMGKSVVLGLHYGSFTTSSSGVYITPDQLEHYGRIMAGSTSTAVVGFGGWKYVAAMYAQGGFVTKLGALRDYFASLD